LYSAGSTGETTLSSAPWSPRVALRLPEIALERQIEARAVGGKEHPHARAGGDRRVDAEDDGHFAGAEADEIARAVDAEQLREAPDQVLIELRPFVALQHAEDAIGRESLLDRSAASASAS
jgi:hypothetical protein